MVESATVGGQVPLSEQDVRAKLLERLPADAVEGAGDRLVVEEMVIGMGRVRADVVTISSTQLVGIEVKSAADTLRRLPRQVEWYGRVFDRCVLAADPHHLDAAAGLLPDWWALVAVDHDGVRTVRPGSANPSRDRVATALLLWREELRAAVAAVGQEGGTAGLERDDLADVLVAAGGSQVPALVRQALLERRWIDVATARDGVRFVRQPSLSRKGARTARRNARRSRARRR